MVGGASEPSQLSFADCVLYGHRGIRRAPLPESFLDRASSNLRLDSPRGHSEEPCDEESRANPKCLSKSYLLPRTSRPALPSASANRLFPRPTIAACAIGALRQPPVE
jgi:hypothetical protein